MKTQWIAAGSVVVLALLANASPAAAGITYVDATWSGENANTTYVDGTAIKTTEEASSTDGLWRHRAYGNGEILEAAGEQYTQGGWTVENVPPLRTRVGRGTEKDPYLPAGKYNVYVYFWQDQAGSPWRIEASLKKPAAASLATAAENSSIAASSASAAATQSEVPKASASEEPEAMPLFEAYGQGTILASDPTTTFVKDPITKDADGRVMWEALLGQVTLDGKTPIEVYVDSDSSNDGATLSDGNLRTWYDGVGYERVP